jgi:outer membrane protein assembly factor BamB
VAVLRRPPLRVWVWTAAVAALVVLAALLWRGSDAAATESTTAPPPDVPAGTPGGAVSEVWSAEGSVLPADVVEGARVVVGSEHGLRALDPLTGVEAWHYTRSNARLCGATATNGVVVAVFRTADRCDEAVALVAGTGVRAWTRNLDLRPDIRLSSTASIVLAESSSGVVTLDPNGNTLRWRERPPGGCRWLDAAAGSAGVAVVQRCGHADVVQLRMLDGFAGTQRWVVDVPAPDGADVALLGADALTAVRVDGELRTFAAADGTARAVRPVPADAAMTSAGGAVLLHAEGTLTALDPATGETRWTAPATGLPGPPADDAAPELVVARAGGFARLDPATGAERSSSTASGVPDGGTATALGPVVVLRLGDRVTGYR